MSADEKTQILAPPEPVAVGTQLSGTYELDQRLASGGMGEVYRGHNIQTGDPVAIKIVLPEFARDPTILSLFRKEASILNHLFHEAIVRYHVFAIDQTIGRPYLAMEFVDGKSLVDLFSAGPMDAGDARVLLIRLASGLAVAHAAGVIHRDLSPDNIVLPDGKVERAKIIDFGIARSESVGGATLLGGSFAGKYNFVSPEQLGLAGGEITERSDIYSLGLVIAAALRGGAINMTGSQVDVVENRRSVPDLTGIDPSMRGVIEQMLQPDPASRPASMTDIVAMLRNPVETSDVWSAASPAREATRPPEAQEPVAAESWPPVTSRTPLPWQTGNETSAGSAAAGAGMPGGEGVAFAGPAAAPAKKSSGAGIGLTALVAIALLVGGAYFGGAFDAFLRPEPVETAPTPPPETPPADEAPAPELPSGEAPAPEQPAPAPPVDETPPQPVDPARPADVEPTPPVAPEAPTPEKPPAQDKPAPPVDEPVLPQPQPPAEEPAQPAPPVESQVPVPEPPVDPETDRLQQRLAWLTAYPGGECFFTSATAAADGKLSIEGYGVDVATFEALLAAYKSAFAADPEPNVGVRLIDAKQCAVMQFLRGLQNVTSAAPTLTLAKDVLLSGDPMVGEMQPGSGGNTYLLLIDHDGLAHNLDGILQRQAGKATFNVELGLGADDGGGDAPRPQLLLALSTSQPLEAMRSHETRPASELLPQLAREFRNRNIEATAAARYFRIRK